MEAVFDDGPVVGERLALHGRAAVEQFGVERAVASIEEVLADPEVEVVSICSPNFHHHDVALASAQPGEPSWIDKPMGASAAQSREIHNAAVAANDGAGVATAVGFNDRPAIAHLREMIAEGRSAQTLRGGG